MKILTYYIFLLALISTLGIILIKTNQSDTVMTMQAMISVSVFLVAYVIGSSLVGEGKTEDERATVHRYKANRYALIAGTVILSYGIIYQLFTHHLDYWLIYGLIGINLSKIGSLIYQHYYK